jgi:hypothetical protein
VRWEVPEENVSFDSHYEVIAYCYILKIYGMTHMECRGVFEFSDSHILCSTFSITTTTFHMFQQSLTSSLLRYLWMCWLSCVIQAVLPPHISDRWWRWRWRWRYTNWKKKRYTIPFLFCGATAQFGPRATSMLRFLNHTKLDTCERVVSSSQRPLPTQHTTNTWDKHKCRQWDSNPRSQQSTGCRPTP